MNSMSSETAVAVELAALKEKVGSMLTTVEDIKHAVQQVVAVDRTVAEHSIHLDGAKKSIDTMWTRIDQVKQADEEQSRSIAAVAEKSEEFKNTWNGAAKAAGGIFGVLQVVLISVCGWLFSLVVDGDRTNVKQQLLIEQLEGKVFRLENRKDS